jgi:hypothetical protein
MNERVPPEVATGGNDFVEKYYDGQVRHIADHYIFIEPESDSIHRSDDVKVSIDAGEADFLIPETLKPETSISALLSPNDDLRGAAHGEITVTYDQDYRVKFEGSRLYDREYATKTVKGEERIRQNGVVANLWG